MDFFSHQEVARRKSGRLVVYFLLAVTLIVIAVYIAVTAIVMIAQQKMAANQPNAQRLVSPSVWKPELFFAVTAGTVGLIAIGTAYKTVRLREGGESVARLLGGRPIDPNTRDLDERVLLNVVEEMAIAAGTPVPPVYLLPTEGGINAFAAGWSPNDAVIGVTRGAIETLTRDELQGVIAHEFSHILNGDMRLNIRLMGLLHGILLIALTGWTILRSLRYVRLNSGGKKSGGGAAIVVVLALGVAFLAIGWIGVFFGRLIKAGVSRQREYLADASAVQFTRNPGGIGGALKKIGALGKLARIENAKAEEVSHMFFSSAFRGSVLNLLSTHPPLDDRIRRIDPQFDGEFGEVNRVRRTARDLVRESAAASGRKRQSESILARAAANPAAAGATSFAFQPERAVAGIGTLDQEHVAYAGGLVDSLPPRLLQAVHEPLGAVAAIYSMLLDTSIATRTDQLKRIEAADRPAYQEVRRLIPVMDLVSPEVRLPLVEMAVPALCRLSGVQYVKLCETIDQLVDADEQISLFEFCLERVLKHHLAAHFVGERRASRSDQGQAILPACATVLSALAYSSGVKARSSEQAFSAGAEQFKKRGGVLQMLPRDECDISRVDRALDRLAAASPAIKKAMIEAAAACIGADGQITVEEGELLRAVAASLDCPMPPLLAGKPAAVASN